MVIIEPRLFGSIGEKTNFVTKLREGKFGNTRQEQLEAPLSPAVCFLADGGRLALKVFVLLYQSKGLTSETFSLGFSENAQL